MALATGTRLGPYEIQTQLGAGGMGEVYKARDTRLERIVAIKVLPAHTADDPEVRQRFEREARTISSLNHPHICTLYDVGHATPSPQPSPPGGEGARSAGEGPAMDFLVMEYLEGETLAQRVRKGALPSDQVLRHAVEIADALDKAHRRGITHRDLKPSNIMLTKAGAKLLDFGLAKLKAPGGAAGGLSALPTQSAGLTAQGAILGTLQYMAPEQLEGKDADARTDIFAFGTMLYEMATGQKAFEGGSQASLIGAILKDEPPAMSSLQPMTPAALDWAVKRCLVKDPDDRWQSARDLLAELNRISTDGSQASVSAPVAAVPSVSPTKRPVSVRMAVSVAVLAAVGAGIAGWSLQPAPLPRPLARFVVTAPPSEPVDAAAPDRDVAISPDGTRIVYISGVGGSRQLYVRPVDQLEATPLRGLGQNPRNPFVSPDSAWVGFFDRSGNALKKVSVHGGPAVTICDIGGPPLRGVSWGPDNNIIFATAPGATGLFRVSAAGGDPEILTTPDSEQGEINHLWPDILPDARAVLFTIVRGSFAIENMQIAVLNLETGEQTVLVSGGSHPQYSPTGHIVYGVDGTLRAVPFDLARLAVTGDPVPVLEGVMTKGTGAANFDFGEDGSLVYVSGDPQGGVTRGLVLVDRQGREEPVVAPPRAYFYPRISPDGGRVALDVRDQENDIWVWDFARETLTRLTFDPGNDNYPVWTPDSRRVVFSSSREGPFNLFWKAADGTGAVERLIESANPQASYSLSPDGTRLVFREIVSETGADLRVLSMEGERAAEPLLQTEFGEVNAEISPDGRWVAYQSNASGRNEVYVRPFPAVDEGRWQISTGGGITPVWAPDGRELFYRAPPAGALMVVRIQTDPTFTAGNPEVLFEEPYFVTGGGRSYDISPDGQRFLMVSQAGPTTETSTPTDVIMVEGWFEELKRIVPSG